MVPQREQAERETERQPCEDRGDGRPDAIPNLKRREAQEANVVQTLVRSHGSQIGRGLGQAIRAFKKGVTDNEDEEANKENKKEASKDLPR